MASHFASNSERLRKCVITFDMSQFCKKEMLFFFHLCRTKKMTDTDYAEIWKKVQKDLKAEHAISGWRKAGKIASNTVLCPSLSTSNVDDLLKTDKKKVMKRTRSQEENGWTEQSCSVNPKIVDMKVRNIMQWFIILMKVKYIIIAQVWSEGEKYRDKGAMPKVAKEYVNSVFSLENLAKPPGSSIGIPVHLGVKQKEPQNLLTRDDDSPTMFHWFLKRAEANDNIIGKFCFTTQVCTQSIDNGCWYFRAGTYMFKSEKELLKKKMQEPESQREEEEEDIEQETEQVGNKRKKTRFSTEFGRVGTIEDLERKEQGAELEKKMKQDNREKRVQQAKERELKKERS
eukprot:GCRY01008235.1.p1 GENE.GCRY01008235.1~~GCRY01008235.1.p1  ORF type:complete len:361 (-),score=48.20 GCRY01008235.1:295-1326(-)